MEFSWRLQLSVNTLTDKAVYRWRETFISDVRLPAMSLGLRLCTSRKGGTGEGGQVSALSLGSMAASGLGLDKLLLGRFLSSFAQKGRENNPPAL